MGDTQSTTREEDFVIEKDLFRRNAFLVISEMVEMLTNSSWHHSELVDEILHSIFFLGVINTPQYTPEDIVPDSDMLNLLKNCFPQPFERYSTELPRRSPISCVLDMIVYTIGQEKEDEIFKRLHELILHLMEGNAKELISSTICVSQRDKTQSQSVRYYGVSMSTSGRDPGRIVVAASCLSIWDSYVADAVMTYYPATKKTYFDGSIKLPEQVRCEAFNISDGKYKDPCKSCQQLFGLKKKSETPSPYGNCAEPESLSNLFKQEKDVREQARPTSPTWTNPNREKAKKAVMQELKNTLKRVTEKQTGQKPKFKWNDDFYTPQEIQH